MQVKAFATPPKFGKTGRDNHPGVGKNDLDFTLEEPEAGLFDEPATEAPAAKPDSLAKAKAAGAAKKAADQQRVSNWEELYE